MKIFFILIIFIIFLIFIIVRDYQIKKKKLKLNNALNSNFFIQTINKLIDENKYNLLEERIRLREIDAYGNEDYKKWIGNPPLEEKAIEKNIFNGSKRFKEGIPYFYEKVILKEFGSTELFFEKWRSYCNENPKGLLACHLEKNRDGLLGMIGYEADMSTFTIKERS